MKKEIKNKVLAALLTIVALAAGHTSVWADGDILEPSIGIEYEALNNDAMVVGYNGTNGVLVVPETVPQTYSNENLRGKTVTTINAKSFLENTGITKVVLGDKINTIGFRAFKDCTNLKEVVIGSGLKTLEAESFYNCINLEKFNCTTTEGIINVVQYPFNNSPLVVFYGYHGSSFHNAVKNSNFYYNQTNKFIGLDAHTYGESPTWRWSNSFDCDATFNCTGCSFSETKACTVTEVVTEDPTYTSVGYKHYEANVTDSNGKEYTGTTEPIEILKLSRNVQVDYVKLDGTVETVSATVLAGDEEELTEEWYAVVESVSNPKRLVANRTIANGGVNIILCDDATLTNNLGITVNGGNALTVWGQTGGTGSWKISETAGNNAGIGGSGYVCGNVTINGGNIEVVGGATSAAIGAGHHENIGSSVITINGGVIKATGGANGAGIGGGYSSTYKNQGSVIINGGTIEANGGSFSSGIGGGYNGYYNVTINGGHVTAQGGSDGGPHYCAGIGRGFSSNEAALTVALTYTDDVSVTSNGYSGTVTLSKPFTDGSKLFEAGRVSDPNTLSNTTLVPCVILNDNDSDLGNDEKNAAIIGVLTTPNRNIAIKNRTLYKNGSWNTLCLPFSMTDGQIAASSLAGATIKEINNSADGTNLDSNGKLTLKFTTVNSIVAGKPYIVKWNPASDENVVTPIFNGVTVTSRTPTGVTSNDNKVQFVGQYSPFKIGSTADSDDGNLNEIILLSSGNTLGYSKSARTLGCFRAHFYVPTDGSVGAVRSYVLDFGDEASGIVSATMESTAQGIDGWYTLDGRRLSGKPAVPGIYVNNGKKIVIK